MSPRERILAMAVLGIVVIAGLGLIVHQFYLSPLEDKNAEIAALQKEVDNKNDRVRQIMAQRPKLNLWRQLSLPANTNLANREYEKYLSELIRLSGVTPGAFTVTPKPPDTKSSPTLPGKKEPIYTRLTYTVHGYATLDNLVDLLERFYRTSLLHQIKSISIQRPIALTQGQRPTDLDINMTIEAIVLADGQKRDQLLPVLDRRLAAINIAASLQGGPGALALVPFAIGPTGPLGPGHLATTEREYAAITGKNVFFGPPVETDRSGDIVDVTQYVHLTDITHTVSKVEAFLYDRYNNKKTRLRTSAGFNSFKVQDNQGNTLVSGKVLRMADREIIFQVGDKHYSMHVGQSLLDAMAKAMPAEKVKSLGLAEKETSAK
jgi:hypothetical protein